MLNKTHNFVTQHMDRLIQRSLPDGGFSNNPDGGFRVDATAWATIALQAAGCKEHILNDSRSRLVANQVPDGRINLLSDDPDVVWPTPLAILAWQGVARYHEMHAMSIDFLIKTTGVHWAKNSQDAVGHDTSIKGWPWILSTHSWVEPTAISLIALEVAGYGEHDRAKEGRRMLMDRQLPSGGWNYGNTTVFGRELQPMPETTGVALSALEGRVPTESVRNSLDYLKNKVRQIRTPLALSWSLLGLSAWGERPREARKWILECLTKQENYGIYDTVLLSLLMVSTFADNGIKSIYNGKGN
jgi:hypothetical protein